MSVIAIIPARGGSKGIVGKNIKLLNGLPLIGWTIKAAKEAKKINRIIISTDDGKIAEVSKELGAEVPFLRPKELAGDKTPMAPVILHMLNWLRNEEKNIEAIVLLQPTSPLRTAKHIDEAVGLFQEKKTTVVSIVDVPHNFNPLSVMKEKDGLLEPFSGEKTLLGRQNKPKVFARNGPAILILQPETIEKGNLYASPCTGYLMDRLHSVDIDEPFDFELAEMFFKHFTKNLGEI